MEEPRDGGVCGSWEQFEFSAPSINVARCEWPLRRGKLHFYDHNEVTEEMHPKNRTTPLVQESGRCQIRHCKSQISCRHLTVEMTSVALISVSKPYAF